MEVDPEGEEEELRALKALERDTRALLLLLIHFL